MRMTIPMVIDSDGKIERVYDIYSRLLKDRIVCVMCEVSIFYISLKLRNKTAFFMVLKFLFFKLEASMIPVNSSGVILLSLLSC